MPPSCSVSARSARSRSPPRCCGCSLSTATASRQFRRQLLEHCVCVGLAARILARRQDTAHPEKAFLSGTVHELGTVILTREAGASTCTCWPRRATRARRLRGGRARGLRLRPRPARRAAGQSSGASRRRSATRSCTSTSPRRRASSEASPRRCTSRTGSSPRWASASCRSTTRTGPTSARPTRSGSPSTTSRELQDEVRASLDQWLVVAAWRSALSSTRTAARTVPAARRALGSRSVADVRARGRAATWLVDRASARGRRRRTRTTARISSAAIVAQLARSCADVALGVVGERGSAHPAGSARRSRGTRAAADRSVGAVPDEPEPAAGLEHARDLARAARDRTSGRPARRRRRPRSRPAAGSARPCRRAPRSRAAPPAGPRASPASVDGDDLARALVQRAGRSPGAGGEVVHGMRAP